MKAKKLLSLVLAAGMTLTMAAPAVNADDDVKVLLDGKELAFDVPAQIIGDRTVVPFRGIFEELGYEVDWVPETRSILAVKTVNETDAYSINMAIDRNTAFLFGKDIKSNPDAKNEIDKSDLSIPSGVIAGETYYQVDLDVPPMIVNDRTLVPARAVAEMSGYKVDWDADSRNVSITSPADIMTGPGPAMPEATTNPGTQTGPGPVMPEATTNPAAQTTPGPAELPIAYDDTNELQSHSVRYFELLSAEKGSDGNYEITFTFKTFMEGRGEVSATFNCLDESGKVIGSFGGSYLGSDYAWSPHTDTATIPGATVKIELAL